MTEEPRIDPAQFAKKPPRPVREIVADILHFPVYLPSDTPFDSSKRLAPGAPGGLDSTLAAHIEGAEETINHYATGRGMMDSLRAEIQPIPKEPVLETSGNHPSVQLAYSKVQLEKLLMALQGTETRGRATDPDKEILRKFLHPVMTLMAASADADGLDMSEGEKGHDALLGKLKDALYDLPHDDAAQRRLAAEMQDGVARYRLQAENIRTRVMPLLQELATALNITLLTARTPA